LQDGKWREGRGIGLTAPHRAPHCYDRKSRKNQTQDASVPLFLPVGNNAKSRPQRPNTGSRQRAPDPRVLESFLVLSKAHNGLLANFADALMKPPVNPRPAEPASSALLEWPPPEFIRFLVG
jgi:hypothetical protein